MPLTYFQPSQVDSSFNGYLRNRIINGAMMIDQRNAGAATANTINGYTVDRWIVGQTVTGKLIAQQNAGAVTPPATFSNYLGVTSQSAYSVLTSDIYRIYQIIEGVNAYDLSWGTASASTVTLSFWVRSSLTGTFGGAIGAANGSRTYVFTYTINGANTWEYKTVQIPGDTSGTYPTNNTASIAVQWGLGVGATYSGTAGSWTGSALVSATGATSVVGTNGATFYITGVQLEVGAVATPFERRQYTTELQLAKRYFDKTFAIGTAPVGNAGRAGATETLAVRSSSGTVSSYYRYSVPMRALPTMTYYNPQATNSQARNLDTASDCTGTAPDNINEIGGKVFYLLPAGASSTNLVSVHWTADAEL